MSIRAANERVAAFTRLLDEELTPEQQVSVLKEIATTSVSSQELLPCVRQLLAKSWSVHGGEAAIDLVGMAREQGWFGVFTTAAFIAAGAGIKVAKQSNGVADVAMLQALAINLAQDARVAQEQLKSYGLTFLASDYFHPALGPLKSAQQSVTRQPSINLLDLIVVLANPARVTQVVLGVTSPQLIDPTMETLKHLGVTKAMVFHSAGLDVISVMGSTQYAYMRGGVVGSGTICPSEYGFKTTTLDALQVASPVQNAETIDRILSCDMGGPLRDMTLLNAAAAVQIGYPEAIDFDSALRLAQESLDSGVALQRLKDLRHQ